MNKPLSRTVVVAFRIFIFCLSVSFYQLPRSWKFLGLVYLNSQLSLRFFWSPISYVVFLTPNFRRRFFRAPSALPISGVVFFAPNFRRRFLRAFSAPNFGRRFSRAPSAPPISGVVFPARLRRPQFQALFFPRSFGAPNFRRRFPPKFSINFMNYKLWKEKIQYWVHTLHLH